MKRGIIAGLLLISLSMARETQHVDDATEPPVTKAETDVSEQKTGMQDTSKQELQINRGEEKVPSAPVAEKVQSGAKPFVPQVQASEEARTEIVFPQNPRLSAFLSVTFPGLGQLYQGRYLTALMFTGSFAIASGVIAYLANENREASATVYRLRDEDGNLVELKQYNDLEVGHTNLNTAEKAVNIAAFAVVGVSYIWSVVDAYRSAKAYNRNHFFNRQSRKLGFRPKTDTESHGFELVYRF